MLWTIISCGNSSSRHLKIAQIIVFGLTISKFPSIGPAIPDSNLLFSLELSESDDEAPGESNIAAAFDGPNDLFGNISDLSDED